MNIKERLKEYGILASILAVIILYVGVLIVGYSSILYFVTPEECREAPSWFHYVQEGVYLILGFIGLIFALCLGAFIAELIMAYTPKIKFPKLNVSEKAQVRVHKTVDVILYPVDKGFTFLAWLIRPLHRFLTKYEAPIFITITVGMAISAVVVLIFEVFKAYYCL